ncbi:hypothetical protein BS78_10G119500 [Paspalum vaginatum]|nr:hypothetical protein BS78_10G119500 [Paspalum vaginatum]KAJ1259000.1 hypothetical protein BS78_10G119500 [Paspalum vaginatum]
MDDQKQREAHDKESKWPKSKRLAIWLGGRGARQPGRSGFLATSKRRRQAGGSLEEERVAWKRPAARRTSDPALRRRATGPADADRRQLGAGGGARWGRGGGRAGRRTPSRDVEEDEWRGGADNSAWRKASGSPARRRMRGSAPRRRMRPRTARAPAAEEAEDPTGGPSEACAGRRRGQRRGGLQRKEATGQAAMGRAVGDGEGCSGRRRWGG